MIECIDEKNVFMTYIESNKKFFFIERCMKDVPPINIFGYLWYCLS